MRSTGADTLQSLFVEIDKLSEIDFRLILKTIFDSKSNIKSIAERSTETEFFTAFEDHIRYFLAKNERFLNQTYDREEENNLRIQDQERITRLFRELEEYFVSKYENRDGIISKVLSPEGELCKYIVDFFGLEIIPGRDDRDVAYNKQMCTQIINEIFSVLHNLSLKERDDKLEVYNVLMSMPQYGGGEDLNCTRGTFNRIENINLDISCSEEMIEFYQACQDVVVGHYTDKICKSRNIPQDYHVHVPNYLYYSLSVISEENKDLMAESKMFNEDLMEFCYDCCSKVRQKLKERLQEKKDVSLLESFKNFIISQSRNIEPANDRIDPLLLEPDNTIMIRLRYIHAEYISQIVSRSLQDSYNNNFLKALDFILLSHTANIVDNNRNLLQVLSIIESILDPTSYQDDASEIREFSNFILSSIRSRDGLRDLNYESRIRGFRYKILSEINRSIGLQNAIVQTIPVNRYNLLYAIICGEDERGVSDAIKKDAILGDFFKILEYFYSGNAVDPTLAEEFAVFIEALGNRFGFAGMVDELNGKVNLENPREQRDLKSLVIDVICNMTKFERFGSIKNRVLLYEEHNQDKVWLDILYTALFIKVKQESYDSFHFIFKEFMRTGSSDLLGADMIAKIKNLFVKTIESDSIKSLKAMIDVRGNEREDVSYLLKWQIYRTSFLHTALINKSVKIADFLIQQGLKEGYSIQEILTDNTGLFSSKIAFDEFSDLVSNLHISSGEGARLRIADINDIDNRLSLIVQAINNKSYLLIERIFSLFEKEAKSPVALDVVEATRFMQSFKAIEKGILAPNYEQNIKRLQEYYQEHQSKFSMIDKCFWSPISRGDQIVWPLSMALENNDVNSIKTVLKGMRLILFREGELEKKFSKNKYVPPLIINSALGLAQRNHFDFFYDLLTILPTNLRYSILFQRKNEVESSTLLEDILSGTEDRSEFVRNLFQGYQRVEGRQSYSLPELFSTRDKMNNFQGGLVHQMAYDGTIKQLGILGDIGVEFSEFNYEDEQGKTPFEVHLNVINELLKKTNLNGIESVKILMEEINIITRLKIALVDDYSKNDKILVELENVIGKAQEIYEDNNESDLYEEEFKTLFCSIYNNLRSSLKCENHNFTGEEKIDFVISCLQISNLYENKIKKLLSSEEKQDLDIVEQVVNYIELIKNKLEYEKDDIEPIISYTKKLFEGLQDESINTQLASALNNILDGYKIDEDSFISDDMEITAIPIAVARSPKEQTEEKEALIPEKPAPSSTTHSPKTESKSNQDIVPTITL